MIARLAPGIIALLVAAAMLIILADRIDEAYQALSVHIQALLNHLGGKHG